VKRLLVLLTLQMPGWLFAQLTDSSMRLVHLQGAVNVRDIGGYPAADGKTVKWGKVYRSADISKLTDDDLQQLKSRHINSVVDFRGKRESAAAPDRLLPDMDYILSPAGSDQLPPMPQMITMIREGNFLVKMYDTSSVGYFGDRYRPLFQKLLTEPDSAALLYHCTGGRDRTGMATALFLYILGVPMNTIEADFTASNVYLAPSMVRMFGGLSKMSGMDEALIEKSFLLTPELLLTFFQAISVKYGSVDRFCEQALGIGPKERAILKDRYTN
jgi:protein-tyrosine phosphatase